MGTKGRPVDAVLLGGIVTITHTIGVFALGFVTLLLSRFIVPETLYPWLTLTSGLLVVVVGGSVLFSRARRRGHHHHHDHGHEHATSTATTTTTTTGAACSASASPPASCRARRRSSSCSARSLCTGSASASH